MVGCTSLSDKGESRVYLIKTDSQGNKLWDRVFGYSYLNWGEEIHQTIASGYIITGLAHCPALGVAAVDADVYLVKTDSEGLVHKGGALLERGIQNVGKSGGNKKPSHNPPDFLPPFKTLPGRK